jgi:hypothetical protein
MERFKISFNDRDLAFQFADVEFDVFLFEIANGALHLIEVIGDVIENFRPPRRASSARFRSRRQARTGP